VSIFLNADSKVIVQGMTGSEGRKHTQRMLTSGTKIVGAVTPRKGGQIVEFDNGGVPVFNSVGGLRSYGRQRDGDLRAGKVHQGCRCRGVSRVPLAIVITEGVPVKDTARFFTVRRLGDPVDRA
jgi:succinyl-CoA synthetase alpha subunit